MRSEGNPSTGAESPILRTQGENVLVFGRKGSGKTSLIRSYLARRSRVLVVDPFREYVDLAVEVSSLQDVASYISQTPGKWKIAYHNHDLNRDFEPICRGLLAVGGNCTLIIEETDWYTTPRTMPAPLEEIVKYGRDTVSLVTICRNPSELPILIRSQAWSINCFCLLERAHVEWVSAIVDPDFAEGINKLPPSFYHYQDLTNPGAKWERRQTDARFRSQKRTFIRSAGM